MIPLQGVDKAQGSRPPDKAFPADPELLERGLAEQKVNLGGCAREDRLELRGMGILSQAISETGQAGLNTSEARTEQRGAASQQRCWNIEGSWGNSGRQERLLEGSRVARRAERISGQWIKAGQVTSLQQ